MKNISRMMGVFWMITSLSWAILSILGLLLGLRWLENLEVGLDDNFHLIIASLDTVQGIVTETTDVISSTQDSLASVQLSVHDTSIALSDARPLLWRTTKVITTDVPDALEGVQESMPTLIATAKAADDTLTWLSNFGFTVPNPFGADLSYDLGIDYAPSVPLDQALEEMSGNLEGVPADLRAMKESLNTADANLVVVSDDLALLAGDLETLNHQIADTNPQLLSLTNNIGDIQTSFQEIQDRIPKSIKNARRILMAVTGLLVAAQIPTMFLGWALASSKLLLDDDRQE